MVTTSSPPAHPAPRTREKEEDSDALFRGHLPLHSLPLSLLRRRASRRRKKKRSGRILLDSFPLNLCPVVALRHARQSARAKQREIHTHTEEMKILEMTLSAHSASISEKKRERKWRREEQGARLMGKGAMKESYKPSPFF